MSAQKMYIMSPIIHTKTLTGAPTNGATTGPHLHYSLYINGESVNPVDYLGLTNF